MKIAVSSGKPGTGKTFASTNLAVMFAEMGRGVTYIDCDIEKPNRLLSLNPDITSVTPFIVNGKKEGRIKHGRAWSIDFHSGLTDSKDPAVVARLISELKALAGRDITVYDSPSCLGFPLDEILHEVDYCVLVLPSSDEAAGWADDVVRSFITSGYNPGIVFNREVSVSVLMSQLLRDYGLSVLGEIAGYDARIEKTASEGNVAVDCLPEYRGIFGRIAENILAEIGRSRKEAFGPA